MKKITKNRAQTSFCMRMWETNKKTYKKNKHEMNGHYKNDKENKERGAQNTNVSLDDFKLWEKNRLGNFKTLQNGYTILTNKKHA